jgi:MFS family permease
MLRRKIQIYVLPKQIQSRAFASSTILAGRTLAFVQGFFHFASHCSSHNLFFLSYSFAHSSATYHFLHTSFLLFMLDLQRRLTNSFYAILSLPATAMGFALCVQISALSWILSTKYGLNIEEVGFVWAAGPMAGILGQVIIGLLSDSVWFWNGRRRPFILVGGTLAALMVAALPNIDRIAASLGVSSLLAVAVAVALTLDLSINISFNPTRSIIADVTPEGEPRTKGYTWMQTISGMFGVVAYLIGAIWGNYTLIYVGVGVVLLCSLIPPFFIAEPRELKPSANANATNDATMTDIPQLLRIYLAHAFSWLGVQTMFVYIFAFIQHKMSPISDKEIGQVIAIAFAVLNTVGFILPASVLEPLAKKVGRVRTHIFCLSIMAAGYFSIVGFGTSPIALYGLMLVVGIGWGAVVSLPFAVMTEKVNKSKMGLFMGIFNLSVVLPQLVASLVVGKFINAAPDKSIIFLISGISLALSAALWALVKEVKGASPEASISAGGGH